MGISIVRWFLAALAMFVASAAMAQPKDEISERSAIRKFVHDHFRAEQFDELDRYYGKRKAELLASGVPVSGQIRSAFGKTALMPLGVPGAMQIMKPGQDPYKVYWEWLDRCEQMTSKWVSLKPRSSFSAVAQSQVFLTKAWLHRDLSEVPGYKDDLQKNYFRYVDQADKAIHRVAPEYRDSMWHAQRLEVLRHVQNPGARYADAVETALEADPFHLDSYFEIAYGMSNISVESVDRFARFAVDKTKERFGNALYARIYWAAYSGYVGRLVESGRLDWPLMKSGFDDMLERYPDTWNMNAYARFACMARDGQTLAQVLRRIGDQVVPQAWANRGEYNACKKLAQTEEPLRPAPTGGERPRSP